MDKIVARLFLVRDIAHREHLKTTGTGSFARHSALGEFYEAIVEKADEIAEAYQGRYGLIEDIPYLVPTIPGDIVEVLKGNLAIIEQLRYEDVPREDTAIQNLIDEAVGVFLKALYKLQFLS